MVEKETLWQKVGACRPNLNRDTIGIQSQMKKQVEVDKQSRQRKAKVGKKMAEFQNRHIWPSAYRVGSITAQFEPETSTSYSKF